MVRDAEDSCSGIMTTAMETAMEELQHPPSPRHLAEMYTSQQGTVVRSIASYCMPGAQQCHALRASHKIERGSVVHQTKGQIWVSLLLFHANCVPYLSI